MRQIIRIKLVKYAQRMAGQTRPNAAGSSEHCNLNTPVKSTNSAKRKIHPATNLPITPMPFAECVHTQDTYTTFNIHFVSHMKAP